MLNRKIPFLLIVLITVLLNRESAAQMITGNWKGRINRQKVEVKIIQQGDSLTGTSYYFESPANYRRYSIKGYFDAETNSAVWWDDQLLEEKSTRFSLNTPGKIPMLSRADFNCPGGGKMMLDGKVSKKEDETGTTGEVHLDKSTSQDFNDEWDWVIDNYTIGANDPDIIDSIESLSKTPIPGVTETTNKPVARVPTPIEQKQPTKQVIIKPVATQPAGPPLTSIKEKFNARQKILVKEIPIFGDSIELRFYDNAEIDGDSISLFLNNKLYLEHIRLTGNAYIVMLPVSGLGQINELIMVAENMGSIPPNTSYMVAIVGEQRYDAYLSSTEGSSAMIRFVKKE